MALLESADEHRPAFLATTAGDVRRLALTREQRLEHISRLELFRGILDQHYETRPGVGKPTKVLVKDALVEHGELYEVPAGTVVFAEGSFGEHLYVLLRGQARSSTSYALDADRNAKLPLDDMTDGDFFGEHSALAMGAHLISVEATAPSLLLLIPQFIVQELTQSQEGFRRLIMGKYVSRAVRTLIRRIPMLRFASDQEFANLLDQSDLKPYQVGEVIFEEGDPSDDVYVVHDGFVKIAKRIGNEQRVLSYLVEGDCFGEVGALSGDPRGASATAMSRVEVLAIPGAEFRRVVQSNPAAVAEASALDNIRKLDAD
ncbi:MAG: cyclic nucleotide-binding domain-containing protein, partial [Candidatus Binatia bacterium]